jgi:methylenetetrahydrofolate--tRNA-(uracil-5-)-methyltransferase
VQLRAADEARTSYNMVGFQTRLTQPEQRRVFRLIPGLERAAFLRYGSIHRNTYLDSPRLLGRELELRAAPRVRVAGQLGGVEGYLESTALGLLAGLFLAAELRGSSLATPPRSTALGALLGHVTRPRAAGERFEPSNITFGLLPPVAGRTIHDKGRRRAALAARARRDLEAWLDELRAVIE